MKKWFAIFLALFALAVGTFIILSITGKIEPEHTVETWFAGFTNTPAGPVARVAVHFKPHFPLCVWPDTHAYRLNAGTWELWTPPPGNTRPPTDYQDYEDGFGNGPDGRSIGGYWDFAVENTNDAWRLVVGVFEYPPDPLPVHLRLLVLWNRWTKPPPGKTFLAGPQYFLTNDTRKMN